jgi:hypothetical protein
MYKLIMLGLFTITGINASSQNYYVDNSGISHSDTMSVHHKSEAVKIYSAHIESSVGIISQHIPFWLRSKQYGSVPFSDGSASVTSFTKKEFQTSPSDFLNWGAGIEVRVNAGKKLSVTLIEGYGNLKIGVFQIKGGRWKEVIGLCDSSLGSGSFAISGNALGIPKIEIAVPNFSNLLGGKLFTFKGNFAHGWVGEVPIQSSRFTKTANTYFHQVSFYGRIGKPDWKLKLFAGINHNVFWGDERKIFADEYHFSDWKTYAYVVFGKVARTLNVAKVGNHIGSIDLGGEYNFSNAKLFLYRQQFYDVGALGHMANILDGLNGISLQNKKQSHSRFYWKKLLLEVMYSGNQAGEPWSPKTATGAENYYNHDFYAEGWSYKGLALGSPFMTTREVAREGQASHPKEYFINNRVLLFHTGMEGRIGKWSCTTKLSYSRNYGTWATNVYGRRAANNQLFPPVYGLFKKVNQFSGFAEVSKPIKNGLTVGGSVALDYGKLLPNSFGTMLKLSKAF